MMARSRWGKGRPVSVVSMVVGALVASVFGVVASAGPAAAAGLVGVSIADVAVVEGDVTSEGAVQALVPLVLSAPQPVDVVVAYKTGTGTATPGSRYTPSADYSPVTSKTIKIPAGRTSVSVPVMVWGDTVDEGDETVPVQLTAVQSGNVALNRSSGTLTILDDDPNPGTPTLGVGDLAVDETDGGMASMALNITLSAPQPFPVVVNWMVTGGSATPGIDAAGTVGSTTIPAGRTRGHTVKQWAIGDGSVEPAETLQVTISTPTPGVTVARPTGTVTLANDDSLRLWSWGHNAYGDLGVGDLVNRTSPTQSPSATDWKTIATKGNHNLAIAADGTLWTWGWNANGQLGFGDTMNRTLPTQLSTATNWAAIAGGYYHSLAIKTDGTLWSWGHNAYGQLGLGDTTDRWVPTQVGSDSDWVAVSGGFYHSVALKSDGTLWTWGYNAQGQLGQGYGLNKTTPTKVGTATDWSFIEAGGFHTLAIKTNGTLWSWGNNFYGQLGLGDNTNRFVPTQVGTGTDWAVARGGNYHVLALKTNGTLWSWGNNGNGQLGLGDTTYRNTPAQVGTATNWVRLSAGEYHSVALKTGGTLWVWGQNIFGQLGLGDTANRNTPTQVGTSTNWAAVEAGRSHTVTIRRV